MAHKRFFLWMTVMVLVYGMMVVSCDNGSTDGPTNGPPNGDNGEPLPPASGVNAISGKTYYEGSHKIVLSTTPKGAANGTFTDGFILNYSERNGEYVFHDPVYENLATGTYTWNEEAKTVTLRRERVTVHENESGTDGIHGTLMDRTTLRQKFKVFYEQLQGQGYFDQELLEEYGFSSVAAYIDFSVNYEVNEIFLRTITYGYSFSNDETALFLEEIPAKKGTNEFAGQTYYGRTGFYDPERGEYVRTRDENQIYVFTTSGYTYTDSRYGETSQTKTGSYGYNSTLKIKIVRLIPSVINGQNRAAYYETLNVYSDHHFVDDNTYRAAMTNRYFSFNGGSGIYYIYRWNLYSYDSANKTLY